MKEFLIKIYNWCAEQLAKVKSYLLFDFIVGSILAAFFCIVLGMKFCIWPSLIVAGIVFGYTCLLFKKFDWWGLGMLCGGGLIIQIFAFFM